MKEQPLRNKISLCIFNNQVLLCWLSSHTYFSQLLSILCVWLLFFPCLIIPVIIHDRTSTLKRSASKLIKWNDSLMSALWRDEYEQAPILDDACNLCLDLHRNRWEVSPQHFTWCFKSSLSVSQDVWNQYSISRIRYNMNECACVWQCVCAKVELIY